MKKIMFVSLGCDNNLVDSEVMLGLLSEKGYGFTDEEEKADIIIHVGAVYDIDRFSCYIAMGGGRPNGIRQCNSE